MHQRIGSQNHLASLLGYVHKQTVDGLEIKCVGHCDGSEGLRMSRLLFLVAIHSVHKTDTHSVRISCCAAVLYVPNSNRMICCTAHLCPAFKITKRCLCQKRLRSFRSFRKVYLNERSIRNDSFSSTTCSYSVGVYTLFSRDCNKKCQPPPRRSHDRRHRLRSSHNLNLQRHRYCQLQRSAGLL
jgi:hypothetical protein